MRVSIGVQTVPWVVAAASWAVSAIYCLWGTWWRYRARQLSLRLRNFGLSEDD